MGIAGYYIYSLIVIGVFLYNCRNWAFIRTTLLYFLFMTFFACLLIYGSAYSLDTNFTQLHTQGWFSAFPLTITGDGPDASTIAKNDPAYWRSLILLVAFFVTFPQAVMRATGLYRKKTPLGVMDQVGHAYGTVRQALAWFKIWLPGTVSNVYDIGEWIFLVLALTSLASPFPIQNLPLMLFSGFFVVLLAGSNLVTGNGLASRILRLFIPGLLAAMQRLMVFVIGAIMFLISVLIGVYAGFLMVSLVELIFRTQGLNFLVIGVIVFLSIGVIALSFLILSKIVFIPLGKLVQWMEIEIMDPEIRESLPDQATKEA